MIDLIMVAALLVLFGTMIWSLIKRARGETTEEHPLIRAGRGFWLSLRGSANAVMSRTAGAEAQNQAVAGPCNEQQQQQHGIAMPQNDNNDGFAHVVVSDEVQALADALTPPGIPEEIAIINSMLVKIHLAAHRDKKTGFGETDLIRYAYGVSPSSTARDYKAAKIAFAAEKARQEVPPGPRFRVVGQDGKWVTDAHGRPLVTTRKEYTA